MQTKKRLTLTESLDKNKFLIVFQIFVDDKFNIIYIYIYIYMKENSSYYMGKLYQFENIEQLRISVFVYLLEISKITITMLVREQVLFYWKIESDIVRIL